MSETEAIAEAAADAAVAKEQASDAKETAEEVEAEVEQIAERVESQWTLTQAEYSDLAERIASLETPPEPDPEPEPPAEGEAPEQTESSEPPSLEMEVKAPPKEKKGIRAKRGASRIKFW